jgi:hypothetical protein
MNGYTKDLPEIQKLLNEVQNIRGFLSVQPCNKYWQARLQSAWARLREYDGLELERHAAELQQMERDNLYNPNGQDRDGEATGISQPVIF